VHCALSRLEELLHKELPFPFSVAQWNSKPLLMTLHLVPIYLHIIGVDSAQQLHIISKE